MIKEKESSDTRSCGLMIFSKESHSRSKSRVYPYPDSRIFLLEDVALFGILLVVVYTIIVHLGITHLSCGYHSYTLAF